MPNAKPGAEAPIDERAIRAYRLKRRRGRRAAADAAGILIADPP
jgi:hypothetical protein